MQANNLGVLGLVNFQGVESFDGTSVRLRLFHGASSTSAGAGTNFYDKTFNSLTNTIAPGSFTLTMTHTSENDPVFNITLSDADGLIATSGNQTLTTIDDFNVAGKVSFRQFAPSGTDIAQLIAVTSAAAMPEPSAAALLGLGIVGLAILRLRRQSR